MNYFIVLLTVSTCFLIPKHPLHAQAPGYLGKKLSVHANLNALPALGGPTAGNRGSVFYGETGGGFAFNWRVGGALAYTVSRKQELRLSFDAFKTGMSETFFTPSGNNGQNNPNDSHELFFNLDGYSVGITSRAYNLNRGALAPLGPYAAWSLQYTRVNGKILDKRTTYAFGGPHAPLGLDLKTNLYTLGYSFGQTLIVADRVLLDFGATMNFDLPIVFKALGSLSDGSEIGLPVESSGDYIRDNNKQYDREVAWRMFKHSAFFFHFGVGFFIH